MSVKEITDKDFNSTIDNSQKLTMVDFWAEWCGPCKMLAPTLEKISEKLEDVVDIYKLNTDENPASAQEFQITSIPCCIVFKNGKEIHRIIGFKPQDTIESELKSLL